MPGGGAAAEASVPYGFGWLLAGFLAGFLAGLAGFLAGWLSGWLLVGCFWLAFFFSLFFFSPCRNAAAGHFASVSRGHYVAATRLHAAF